jgi:hypothetical protein
MSQVFAGNGAARVSNVRTIGGPLKRINQKAAVSSLLRGEYRTVGIPPLRQSVSEWGEATPRSRRGGVCGRG